VREKELSTRIIYVRHGKTDFPKDRIYCDDREDPPLNAEGQAQARAAARLLSSQSPEVIYTSPSSRTRMTAFEISQAVKAPIKENDTLCERRFGIWEGLYFQEISQKYSDAYRLWREDPVHYTPEGGETIDDLLERTAAAIEQMIGDYRGKTILVVSHVGPIRVCLAAALKIPVHWYRQLRIDYGSLTAVDYGASQNNLLFANVSNLLFDLS